MGPVEIVAGLAGAADKLLSAKNEAERNALLVDFQRLVIRAQGETMTLQNQLAAATTEIAQLKGELGQMQDWSVESAKYELRHIPDGAFFWVLKATSGKVKSVQKFCANCFESRRKSLLQLETGKAYYQGFVLVCHAPVCNARVEIPDPGDLTI